MSIEKMIAIYSRKSKYTGKGESIENQAELCKEYIKIHFGYEALKRVKIYEDEGFSGGNLNRPDFKRMMRDVESMKIEAIIVYRLDRISRNISDFSGLINRLSQLSINFISIKEQFDTNNPMGRAMMYISSVFSQLERETIAERIKDNMHELAKSGVWLGGITPTGYKSVKMQKTDSIGKSKSFFALELIPNEAVIIKLIFDKYLEFNSLTKVENELIKMNIKTKNSKLFTRFSIKSILTNPVYAVADKATYEYFESKSAFIATDKVFFDSQHGIMPFNRTHQEKGKAPVLMPVNEWIISVGLHKGIISGKDWICVQQTLNKKKSRKSSIKNKALLTGILFCKCSSRMYPKLTKNLNQNGERKFSYICSLKDKSKKCLCKSKNINGNILDEAILENVSLIYEDNSIFINELYKSLSLFPDEFNIDIFYKNQIENNKLKIKRLLEALIDAQSNNVKLEIEKEIEFLNIKNKEISNSVKKLQSKSTGNTLESIESVANSLLNFKSAFGRSPLNYKRKIIKDLIKNIIWNNDVAEVTYNI